ncbi:MAG: glyoxalase, partial [Butyricicoccus sp.]|nr:glyoxalase [Butyricicoccus sp.]
MRIDHIALYVSDLETMRTFYASYFGGISNQMYHNPRTGLKTYFLTFPDGARLELMTRPELAASEN